MHAALAKGSTAVTGGASGIGLAAARYLARAGLRVCIADCDAGRIVIADGAAPGDVMGVLTDVARKTQLSSLADQAFTAFGAVNVLTWATLIG